MTGTLCSQMDGHPPLVLAKKHNDEDDSIICLNDQGGNQIYCSQNITGSLRAQEHGHQPLIMATQQGGAEIGIDICPTITSAAGTSGNNQPILFDNHGIDSRYTGPHEVAPTASATYGSGGNNTPLIKQEDETYCIAGNIVNRMDKNGGNGFGYQKSISYTITQTDKHCVYSRQRSDTFQSNDITATQNARQYKDATDLVCETYQQTVGTIGHSDHKGINNQYISDDKCIVEKRNLIRRLIPLECERLQGFPDYWTDIGGSDSARYKSLGNSVAIPCVEFVLRGIAYFLLKQKETEIYGTK
jgi:DNA (cytosine-5)-methyltransferase 1